MIKSFRIFESYSKVKSICDRYYIENWELNPETGLVDVRGDVNLQYLPFFNLEKLPLKFGIVSGNFFCHGNQLTSLEGAPQSVGGDFYCNNNQLTSLEGSPQSVGGDFYCNNNQLTSLEGSPQSVGGDFSCINNQKDLNKSEEFAYSLDILTDIELDLDNNDIWFGAVNRNWRKIESLEEGHLKSILLCFSGESPNLDMIRKTEFIKWIESVSNFRIFRFHGSSKKIEGPKLKFGFNLIFLKLKNNVY